MSLKRLKECVTELNTTNSANDKLNILMKYDDCKDYFFYAFNPYYRYGVTSNSKDKDVDTASYSFDHDDLFDLLDDLRTRRLTGHIAIAAVRFYIDAFEQEHEDLIYMILDKNIEVRMGASQINKV
jgi:hypothetical protein